MLVLVGSWLVLRGDPRIDHELAVQSPDSGGAPSTVSDVAWEWPEGTGQPDVEATEVPTLSLLPFGVLVHEDRGVVALNGSTGEEVWRYRVEETRVQAQVSPAGRYVQLFYADEPDLDEDNPYEDAEEDESDVAGTTVILDGTTGDVLFEEETDFERDVESMGGLFAGGMVTDQGVLSLKSEDDGISARMSSIGDEDDVWSVSDVFDCSSRDVETVGSAAFESAVVLRPTCSSGEVSLVALDPTDGSALWSMAEEDSDRLVRDGGIRAGGDVLAVHENAPKGPPGGVLGAERLVLDPLSGEVLGDGVDLEEGQVLAATFEEGYLILNGVSGDKQLYGYELRSFEGEALRTTGDEAVRSENASTLTLPLEEALVTLEARSSRNEPRGSRVKAAAWGADQEATEVRLPRLLSSGLGGTRESAIETFSGLERFVTAPGAVVLVEWPQDEEEDVRVLGFQ